MTEATELLERLRRGDSPAAIARALMPPPQRELLRRVALPRAFDERVVEEVLRPDIPRPEDRGWPFAELVKHPDVRKSEKHSGAFFLAPARRAEYLDDWRAAGGAGGPAVPPALRRLSARLADHFRRRGDAYDLEAFYHRVAAAPRAAARDFERLYRDAEGRS
ncbi:MAG TPA: hypothetical protein VFW33_00160, partial [Gemmataceae bacterium]|nr:hypothetical protein [Gemmataceae bacterium]